MYKPESAENNWMKDSDIFNNIFDAGNKDENKSEKLGTVDVNDSSVKPAVTEKQKDILETRESGYQKDTSGYRNRDAQGYDDKDNRYEKEDRRYNTRESGYQKDTSGYRNRDAQGYDDKDNRYEKEDRRYNTRYNKKDSDRDYRRDREKNKSRDRRGNYHRDRMDDRKMYDKSDDVRNSRDRRGNDRRRYSRDDRRNIDDRKGKNTRNNDSRTVTVADGGANWRAKILKRQRESNNKEEPENKRRKFDSSSKGWRKKGYDNKKQRTKPMKMNSTYNQALEYISKNSNKFEVDKEEYASVLPDIKKLSEDDQKRLRGTLQKNTWQDNIVKQCYYCFDNQFVGQQLRISMGNYVYLILPKNPIVPGHCLIVPMEHHNGGSRNVDEDTWEEIQKYMKSLCKLNYQKGMGTVFIETNVPYKNQVHHTFIECIPFDREMCALGPMYFKKAIEEDGPRWANNPKLIDCSKKGLRRSIPPDFKYFYVQFGMSQCWSHLIENPAKFTPNFGVNILAGIMQVDVEEYRLAPRLTYEQEMQNKVLFLDTWDDFDWTYELDNENVQEPIGNEQTNNQTYQTSAITTTNSAGYTQDDYLLDEYEDDY
eukprot:TRINITY_DN5419_c0_g1_i2.p1 TRINITY_DN5419_c0_g1~~TRINITY_DN5419_c0_g1_i2.p1  ORF type:complete len:595 (+),score=144.73 TRINITY_DN5419_c0_g1_i2:297-2081(+)